jgi:hypothetical protein
MVAVNVITVTLPATLVDRPNAAGIGARNRIVARDSEPLRATARPVARESDFPRPLLYALKAAAAVGHRCASLSSTRCICPDTAMLTGYSRLIAST